jgi:hypothetical protein
VAAALTLPGSIVIYDISQGKMEWTPECQEAFDQMKAIMAKETLVTFPDFTKEFEIHTDASRSYNLELASHKVESL